MLQFYGLPFVDVLLMLADICCICADKQRGCCSVAYTVHSLISPAYATAMQEVVYGAAAGYVNNCDFKTILLAILCVSWCSTVFLCTQRLLILAPFGSTECLKFRPPFAYDVLGRYEHAGSRRRAPARRGDATGVYQVILICGVTM